MTVTTAPPPRAPGKTRRPRCFIHEQDELGSWRVYLNPDAKLTPRALRRDRRRARRSLRVLWDLGPMVDSDGRVYYDALPTREVVPAIWYDRRVLAASTVATAALLAEGAVYVLIGG